MAKLTEMGQGELVKRLKYAENLAELKSVLREYVFHSDAKVDAFLRSVEGDLQGQASTVVNQMLGPYGEKPVRVCPHCHKEIYEKHTYIDGDFMSGQYVDRHSDCKGAIIFPESDLTQIADWPRPLTAAAREKHQAFLQSL